MFIVGLFSEEEISSDGHPEAVLLREFLGGEKSPPDVVEVFAVGFVELDLA